MSTGSSKEELIASMLCVVKRAHLEFEIASLEVKREKLHFDDPHCSDEVATSVYQNAQDKKFKVRCDLEKIVASFLDTSFDDLIRILTEGDQV